MTGNYAPGATLYFEFNTQKADGTPITLASTPVISVHKDGNTTESTAGVTLTVDFDSRAGSHLVTINTAADGTFYSAGSHFSVLITTGTVDGVNVAGTWIGAFDLAKQVTNVTHFGGTAGTFASGRPEVNMTHVRGSQVNTLQSGRMDSYVGAFASAVLDATAIASNAITDSKIASGALTAAKFASGAFDAVWSVATRVLTAGTNIVLAKGTGITGLNDLSAAQVNAEVDTALADYDPPTKAELDSAVVGLATASALQTVDNEVGVIDSIVDAIKAKTDNLPSSPASQSDVQSVGSAVAGLNDLSQADVRSAIGLASADLDDQLSGLSTFDALTDAVIVGAVGETVVTSPDDFKADVSNLDAPVSSRLADADYTAPDNSGIGAIDAALGELIEDDGDGNLRFTAKALEEAPTGEGGGGGGLTAEDVWTYEARTLTDAFPDVPTAADIRAEIDSNSSQLAAIVADTDELQSDWANGGRLDNILDARASQTSVDDVPTVSEFNARTLVSADYATATAVQIVDDELAAVDTVVDAIKLKTDNLPTDPADQSLVIAAIDALNDLDATEVQTAAAAALTAYDPPTNAEMEARTLVAADYFVVTDYTAPNNAGIQVIEDALGDLLEDDGGVLRFTANALEEAPTGGGSGATAEEVWEYGTRTLTDAFPDVPTVAEIRTEMDTNSTKLDATISSRSTLTADQVWSYVDRQVTEVSSAIRNQIADNILRRSLASALSSADGDTKGFRSLAGAIAKLVNRVTVSGSMLTVYETNDSTTLGTQTVTSDEDAEPITGVDTNA